MSKSIRPEPANALCTTAEPKRWIDALDLTLRHLSALESVCVSEEAGKQVAFLSSSNHLPARERQGARWERTNSSVLRMDRGALQTKIIIQSRSTRSGEVFRGSSQQQGDGYQAGTPRRGLPSPWGWLLQVRLLAFLAESPAVLWCES